MKTLTLNQKKVALASCLLAVLASTTSFNSHSKLTGQIDFASSAETVPASVPTDKGVVKVIYISSGSETIATVPKTEGQGDCDYCGSYTLPVSLEKNRDNINALNVALLKKMKESQTHKEVVPASKAKEEAEGSQWHSSLAAIEKKCESKKSNDAVLSCYSSDFAKALSSKKIKLDQDEVVTFFKENIAPLIRNELEATRTKIATILNPNQQYLSQEEYYWSMSSAQEEIFNIDERKRAVSDYLKTMIEATGADHAKFRTALLQTQGAIVRESAQQIKALRMSERQLEKTNPALSVQYGVQATHQTQDLLRWNSILGNTSYLSMQNLVDRGAVRPTEFSTYDSYIRNFSDSLNNYLVRDPYTNNVQNTIPVYTNGQLTQAIQAPVAPGHEPRILLQAQPQAQGQRLAIPGTPATSLNSQLPTLNGTGAVQVITQPYNATPEQLRLRTQIHNQFRK